MQSTFGIKGKVIHSQAREIIANIMHFMQQEAENQDALIPLTNVKERVLAATKISESSYKRIKKELRKVQCGESTSFSTPHKDRPRVSSKSALPEGEKTTIRSIIHDFYITEKKRPTVKGIYAKIIDSGVEFNGSLTTLRTIIRKMGFKWRKTTDKRQILMESQDIRYKRITYLEQLVKYKREGRPIIFTDESYIHSSHTVSKEWSDNSMKGFKKPVSKVRRLIMVHAGNENGFIRNALLMFTSGAKSGDYHDDMNYNNFTKWLTTQLIPNLPPRSVLVVDNASYHNVSSEKNVTFSSTKKEMIAWLVERNFPHDPTKTKAQLYEIIRIHKPRYRTFKLDVLLHQHGHSVLRLPPYHPEFNPIEKIWAIVKNSVASRNTTFKLADVKQLALDKFNSITAVDWAAVCAHVDKEVNMYLEKEHLLDQNFEDLQFVVNTGESDDEDQESDLSGIEALSDDEEARAILYLLNDVVGK